MHDLDWRVDSKLNWLMHNFKLSFCNVQWLNFQDGNPSPFPGGGGHQTFHDAFHISLAGTS